VTKPSGIIGVVHAAMDREKDAAALYLRLAGAVADPKGKNVLIRLASDEVGHLDKLERHLVAVLSGKGGMLPAADLADAMAARLAEGAGIDFPAEADFARADEVRWRSTGSWRRTACTSNWRNRPRRRRTGNCSWLWPGKKICMQGSSAPR
jgi:hypothetical protein